jgi:bla regulator protein blaR1
MTDLIRQISNASGLTIIDKTGYAETFNATLEWTPGELAPSPPGPGNGGNPVSLADLPGPSLFLALQDQLGLKLESTKGPVEVLVIDHVEKPSAN